MAATKQTPYKAPTRLVELTDYEEELILMIRNLTPEALEVIYSSVPLLPQRKAVRS